MLEGIFLFRALESGGLPPVACTLESNLYQVFVFVEDRLSILIFRSAHTAAKFIFIIIWSAHATRTYHRP